MSLLFLFWPAYAAVDLSALSDERLVALYADTEEALRERGKYPYAELASGASGNEVTLFQDRLVELGYLTKEPTGKYDNSTLTAM